MKYRVDHILAALLMAGMALIAFANVLSRYCFKYSFSFTEELTINMFVLLVVIGSGLAFERGSHLGMVSIYNILPKSLRKIIALLSAVLGTLLFLTIDILLVQSIHAEITMFEMKSPSLGIPVWIYYAAVIAVSPSVFYGIYRGTAQRLKELSDDEEGAGS